MKVFMVHENPWNAGNPYIYTLIESLESRYPDIHMGWGGDTFWGEDIFSYDIVHFHWPQAFMAYDPMGHTIEDLKLRISELKNRGILVVATCHDLEPHYNQCSDFGSALTIVYESCDAIFHLGEFSMALFEKKYPESKHFLMYHHVYDTVYDSVVPNKKVSCKRLGLNPRRQYVLCLGAFRSQEERELVKYVAIHTPRRIHFLAPSYTEIPVLKRRHPVPYLKAQLKRLYFRLYYRIQYIGRTWVPVSDEDIKYYYGASDIAFVHRLKILNSGNAVLPLLFGKNVVGPDTGNVGLFLKKIKMPVFNVDDKTSVVCMVMKGLNCLECPQYDDLRLYVKNNLYTKIVADHLYSYYYTLVFEAKR